MYEVRIICTCDECGKQEIEKKTATSLSLLLKHLLFKITKTDFDGEDSVCLSCQIKE